MLILQIPYIFNKNYCLFYNALYKQCLFFGKYHLQNYTKIIVFCRHIHK